MLDFRFVPAGRRRIEGHGVSRRVFARTNWRGIDRGDSGDVPAIFRMLDCKGVVRIDYRPSKATEKVFITEINAFPVPWPSICRKPRA